MDVPYLLAGDIGGTRTRLAVFAREGGLREPVARAEFASAEYPELESIVEAFLERVKLPIGLACFGVAGPVRGGRAALTNLPWVVDEERLRARFNFERVRVMNDVQALAAGVPHLGEEDCVTLQKGTPQAGGTIAVAAVGTGLGASFLTWDGERYRAFPSEAGHAGFAPADPRQAGLFLFLRERFGRVSRERACSGTAIPHLYGYLKEEDEACTAGRLAQEIAAAADPAPLIVEKALDENESDPLCRATLELFVSILGAVCGSLALDFLATGGIFLGGGLPPRILPLLQEPLFLEAFLAKGRMANLMGGIPVRVIVKRGVALVGAASEAMRP
ncbi:MAG: glucokinase [Desulfobacterales bacterium]